MLSRSGLLAICLALLLSSAAQAHGHHGYGGPRGVYFGYYAPPVYLAPPPVYAAPAPVYAAPPPVIVPAPPVYYYPPPYQAGFGYRGPGFSFYYGR